MDELKEIRKREKAAKIRERRRNDLDYYEKCKEQNATILQNRRANNKSYADQCKD